MFAGLANCTEISVLIVASSRKVMRSVIVPSLSVFFLRKCHSQSGQNPFTKETIDSVGRVPEIRDSVNECGVFPTFENALVLRRSSSNLLTGKVDTSAAIGP